MRKPLIHILTIVMACTMMYCAKKQTATATDVNSSQVSETAQDLNAYVGTYKTPYDEVGTINIVLEDGQLFGISEGRPKVRLHYETKDNFSVPNFNNVKLSFKRNTSQKVTGIVLLYGGQEFAGEKVE